MSRFEIRVTLAWLVGGLAAAAVCLGLAWLAPERAEPPAPVFPDPCTLDAVECDTGAPVKTSTTVGASPWS